MNWFADRMSWILPTMMIALLIFVMILASGHNPYAPGTEESILWHFYDIQNEHK